MKPLAGKVALVTGGSRGIGRGIAVRLAAEGALVAINYAANVAAANSLVSEIDSAEGEAFAVQATIGSSPETAKLFAALDNELNKRRQKTTIDILVNNAGAYYFGKLSETSEENFDRVFSVNTKGAFLVTKAAVPRIADGGRIISISSRVARCPGVLVGAYAMAKAAIETMTLSLAAELGTRGITVNAIAPGWTETEATARARQNEELVRSVKSQTALGRVGTPEDIAAVVGFLASDDGRWVTGQSIDVSGGFRLPFALAPGFW